MAVRRHFLMCSAFVLDLKSVAVPWQSMQHSQMKVADDGTSLIRSERSPGPNPAKAKEEPLPSPRRMTSVTISGSGQGIVHREMPSEELAAEGQVSAVLNAMESLLQASQPVTTATTTTSQALIAVADSGNWVTGAYGNCKRTCASLSIGGSQGYRDRTVECKSYLTATIVGVTACTQKKRPDVTQRCNCGTTSCVAVTKETCHPGPNTATMNDGTLSEDINWEEIGCFPRATLDIGGPPSSNRDYMCQNWTQTERCRSGLPFFRKNGNDLTTQVCFDFCHNKGLDLFGLITGASGSVDECRCGASRLNVAVWKKDNPSRHMQLPDWKEPSGGSCLVKAYRYVGAFSVTSLAMASPMVQDIGYIDSVVSGTNVTEEDSGMGGSSMLVQGGGALGGRFATRRENSTEIDVTLMVTTLNTTLADTVETCKFALMVDGAWTTLQTLFSKAARKQVFTKDVKVAKWPTKVRLVLSGSDNWGVRQIALITEVYMMALVLDAPDGQTTAMSQHWLTGETKEYDVPAKNMACNEALEGAKMANYRGCQSTTRNGRKCQSWTAQSPHSHLLTPAADPDAGLENNYCRNPDEAPQLWCFTVDPLIRFELCDPLLPMWNRPCFPGTCGPGLPWSGRSKDAPAGEDQLFKWRDYAIIPYFFGTAMTDERKEVFRMAVDSYRTKTCVNFVEKEQAPLEPYVFVDVVDENLCWVDGLGAPAAGTDPARRTVNLGWCQNYLHLGNVVHEVGHVVGMNHEQKRPDSAQAYMGQGPYLKVAWDVIGHWQDGDFWKTQYSGDPSSYVGSADDGPHDPQKGYAPYDFESIMHYAGDDGGFQTIPASMNTLTGNRAHLTAGDLMQINDMYQCIPMNLLDTDLKPWAPTNKTGHARKQALLATPLLPCLAALVTG